MGYKHLRYAEFSKVGAWAEFHCRSAANRRKRRPISAVGRHGQNGLKRLIAMRFPTPARQFSRAKTLLSAVDSGIGVGPGAGEATVAPAIAPPRMRNPIVAPTPWPFA